MTRKKLFILALIMAILGTITGCTGPAPAQNLKATIRDSQTQGELLTGTLQALYLDETAGLIVVLSSPTIPLKRGYIDGVPFDIYKIDILTKPK